MRGEELYVKLSLKLPAGITPACAGKRVMKMWPPKA